MVGSCTVESSDSAFLRKLRKPLIEKKRRDRMNVSIDSLKALLAKSSNNPASVVKMDKAEILELAVTHLSKLHQRPMTTSTNHVTSYRAGFRECQKEAVRYLNSAAMMRNPLLLDLDNHLQNACDNSGQDDAIMPSGTRKARFISDGHFTRSSTLKMPTVPAFSPYCRNNMFSPIASIEMRGHRMHSPLDGSYFGKVDSSFFMPSPASSTCSSTTSDSSASLVSENVVDSSSDLESIVHAPSPQFKSDMTLDHVIKQEAPWRPW